MNSRTSFASMDPRDTTRTSSRHCPLHTCAVAILAIAHSAYTKAQDFNGTIGSTTRRIAKMAKLVSPLVCAMQYYCLAILSFADDKILAVENMIEKFFPPSNYVFNKVDYLVQIAETLPEKVDNVFDKFPENIHQVQFDCAVVQVISWLNFLITTLTHWRSGSAREKEIMVDTNCKNNESASVDEEHSPESETGGTTVDSGVVESSYTEELEKGTVESSEKKAEEEENREEKNNESAYVDEAQHPISETPQGESETGGITGDSGDMKSSYKEALKKGKKESVEEKAGEEEKMEKSDVGKEEDGEGEGLKKIADKSNEIVLNDVPILDLFESGWTHDPRKKGVKRTQ